MIHSVIHTSAGNEGKNGDNKIRDGRILAYPGHDFGVEGGTQGTPEVGLDIASGIFQSDPVEEPGDQTA